MCLRLLKIRGHSLYPEYREGDYILTAGFPFPSGKIRPGDLIIFDQPGFGTLVKCVDQVLDAGKAFNVRGTQIDSADSRNFGPVPRERVSAKAIWHLQKK